MCAELGLPLAIGSKTVGEAVGKHESAEKVGRVMGNWKKVWQGDEVRQKEELLLLMFEKTIAVGENVIKQGEAGDNFYVIDTGE